MVYTSLRFINGRMCVRYCHSGRSTVAYLTASPLPFFPEQLLFLLQQLMLSKLGLIVILLDVVYSESQGSKYGRCFL